MASGFPHPVSGRVSDETLRQIAEAAEKFKVTEGALVRAALEDFMPRYLKNQAQHKHAALFDALSVALDETPELAHTLDKLTRKTTRQRRTAAA